MTENQAMAIVNQLKRIVDRLELIEDAINEIGAATPPERICKDCQYSTAIEDVM